MKKIFIILFILGIIILSASCAKKTADNNQEYISKTDRIVFNTNSNNEINSEEQFDINLKQFYNFSQRFFSIWNDHIEATTSLLEKFNNDTTSLSDKIIYSRMLVEKYEKFNDDLKQITFPSEASKAYEYTLNAISKRILFFKEFEKETSMDTLIEIENEAYFYESLFWEEINKIYDYYLKEIDKKNNKSI